MTALRAFEAAARHMSFQKAAQELGLSPSGVSHQIRNLESYLDAKLFNRLTRAIELTEAGRQLYPGLEQGFRSIETAVGQVRSLNTRAVIVVTVGPSIAAKWLVPRLHTFEEQYPAIDVRISTSNRVVDLTREDVDIAVRHGRGRYDGLECARLFGEAYTPMCAPSLVDHPDHPITAPTDLQHHRLLHDDAAAYPGDTQGWVNWMEAAGLDPSEGERGQHISQSDHAIQAAIDGAGVLLGRMAIAAPDIAAGRLVCPFDITLPSEFSYFVVTRPGRAREKAIKAFIDWMRTEAARLNAVPE